VLIAHFGSGEHMAKLFSTATENSAARLFGLAIIQTVAFWGFFLFLLPSIIFWFENQVGIHRFDLGVFKFGLIVAFIISGSTCIYCAWLFATRGLGTPVPFAAPRNLVLRGPYRYVRNPMAIGGIFQGVLVGLFLGSWLVILYALSGALFWHLVARPPEERDLLARHGDQYTRYRDEVRCWIPRLRPYDPEAPKV
jgi:protein-S-isoprenylcysteine O-methyltransferase Ste14